MRIALRAGSLALLAACTGSACAEALPTVAIVLNAPPASSLASSPPTAPAARAFFDAMKDRGWIDGRTARFIWRTAEQDPARIPAIVDELVGLKVDVIVASGNLIARVAKEKTRTIPIVLGASEFAMESGLVQSYARPGGNVTGVSMMLDHLDAKRLGILKELAPRVKRIAVLGQLNATNGEDVKGRTGKAVQALGLSAFHVRADRGEDIAAAFADAIRRGADGMIVSSTGPMHRPENQAALARLAIEHRIPVIYAVLRSVESGGLAAYSADELAAWHRATGYVDRILRGARPADLPIEHPSAYLLHVNRKAARAIGIEIPASILAQADRVFE